MAKRTALGTAGPVAALQPKPADIRRPEAEARRGGAGGAEPRQAVGPAADRQLLDAEVKRLEDELDRLRRRMAEIEASAERDPLTEVLNRRGFERELTRAIAYLARYDARAVLIYLDLDDFKPVNDRHGHAAGDALLKAVAATLTRHLRASDSVARLGGDEFAALLWNLSDEDAGRKARALEADIAAATIAWDGASLSAGASAGIAALFAGDRPAEVIARADVAMYARKAQRKR